MFGLQRLHFIRQQDKFFFRAQRQRPGGLGGTRPSPDLWKLLREVARPVSLAPVRINFSFSPQNQHKKEEKPAVTFSSAKIHTFMTRVIVDSHAVKTPPPSWGWFDPAGALRKSEKKEKKKKRLGINGLGGRRVHSSSNGCRATSTVFHSLHSLQWVLG